MLFLHILVILKGTVTCNPEVSKGTGSYDVTCTAVGNNGKTNNVTFAVSHSYNATYVAATPVYHTHIGNPAVQGGCYINPAYHTHNESCYTTCGGQSFYYDDVQHHHHDEYEGQTDVWHFDVRVFICRTCGQEVARYVSGQGPSGVMPVNNNISDVIGKCPLKRKTCPFADYQLLGYNLSCGKTEATLEYYTCPADQTLSGSKCYLCPDGGKVKTSDEKCYY